jgi:hypothetical protein
MPLSTTYTSGSTDGESRALMNIATAVGSANPSSAAKTSAHSPWVDFARSPLAARLRN